MTITVGQFRQDFTEFESKDRFPDGAITYYLKIAGLLLNAQRFAEMLDTATELFVAHNISIERRARDEALKGAQPGVTTGPVASKGVGPVSISYDVGLGLDPKAGHWNLTVYGTRLWDLISMFGAGPIQVNIGQAPPYVGAAWFGPYLGVWPP